MGCGQSPRYEPRCDVAGQECGEGQVCGDEQGLALCVDAPPEAVEDATCGGCGASFADPTSGRTLLSALALLGLVGLGLRRRRVAGQEPVAEAKLSCSA